MLEYKGYTGQITTFDETQGLISGRVLGIQDIVSFAGKSVDELAQAFRDSVDDYLQWCEESGDTPQQPYSGKLMLRISSDMHKQIEQAAHQADMTVNSWLMAVVNDFLQRNFLNGHLRPATPTKASSTKKRQRKA